MKYLYSLLILIFMQGCFSTVNTINKSNYAPQTPQNQQKILKKQKSNQGLYNIKEETIRKSQTFGTQSSSYTGSIKGIISSLKYDKQKKYWIYGVTGKDTSHGKLSYAKFSHDKKLANVGDEVYIILDNSKLQDLFFIKKSNKFVKKRKFVKKVKKSKNLHKSDKYRKNPGFGVPTVENVTF